MLKYWLALLLVLNAAVLAWQWDAFARWGHGPNQEREPERLQQQVRPEALKFVVIPPTASTAESPAVEASDPASAVPQDASAPSAPTATIPVPALPAPAPAAPPAAPR
ncbi:hypothetical protein [Limnohabitans sp. Bal53]|uniref:hypothetical protein n=1 Tax=Limnohabitans sp. Bal53 TaxID=1977910 RepID=UPI000D36EF7F|nr:hypothetical protein [Limnohabitans sp. Bal53]PUE42949.1 hypothetical protein B9Z50_03885 [Limnohabitans sp. Bal53]